MARTKESPEATLSETESIMQEYQERIRKALELESSKLKEKAEEESGDILVKAREQAEKVIDEAKQAAQEESEKIIAEAREQAEVIINQAREEARQESVRVASEAKEMASQIIADAIKRGTIQAQCEFARVASEVGNKTYQLMTQISKSIEQVIGETEANFRIELERISSAVSEEESAPAPGIESPDETADSVPQTIVGEIAPPAPSVSEKTEISYTSIIEKRHVSIKEEDNTNLFKGKLKLEMVPPYAQERLEGIPAWLSKIDGIRVLSTNCYASANRWITAFTIDLEEPTPLLKTLKSVSQIKDVTEHKGNIVITLR
jgi:F0F1-type ATP synthase membrane subunit b/b'